MNDSTRDLAAALAKHRIIGQLGPQARDDWQARLSLRRFSDRQPVADATELREQFGLVVAGQVALDDGGGSPLLLGPGEWFGAGAFAAGGADGLSAQAQGPTTVAFADRAELVELCAAHPQLRPFLTTAAPVEPTGPADPHMNLMQTPVRSLIKREPITVPPGLSIREAAQLMRERRVSSVLVVEQGRLFGLVTDRDLRNRALATGLDSARPVIDITTVAPLTIEIGAPGFEALLMMARHNIHHVPVLDDGKVAGMITATDVTEQHSTSAVYLAGDIHKQSTLEGLVAAAAKVKQLQRHLAAAGASAYATGHIVTAITDALTVRLLHLGEAKFGPPPVDYCWVAAGSQARSEQTAKSDQDNCMILDDRYDERAHGAYFKSLATFVCDGLDACGYIHCPGEMMAMTDKWRLPLAAWIETFRGWIDTPEPMALMLTCVFFDVRAITGRKELLSQLRETVLPRAKASRLFLGHMVNNALSHQPPLGLFGGISTIRSGEHKGKIDLKHTGIVPVVDLARVYSLAAGDNAVNSHDRLAHAADSGEISPPAVRDLRDALEFLASLRIRHQAHQIGAGQAADNFMNPSTLSNFERGQLKDAFGVVKSLQDVLTQRYRGMS